MKLREKLVDAFEYIFNDMVITVGTVVFNTFTMGVSLFYAITNTMPIIPQWTWAGIFGFMLLAGTFSMDDLIHIGYDEEGNDLSEPDDEDDDDVEDDEIVPD